MDLDGLVLAPGFIDLHMHADFTLPLYPRAPAYVRQGVTTIVVGNCGFSPFPVESDRLDLLRHASAFLVDAPRSFREATTACRLGYVVNGPGSLTRYGDLGAYPALFDLVSSPSDGRAFETLRDRYLEPILRYEARTRLPLIETLTALFDANGNVSAAARALGINRQSLLYRLGKVEALTSVNLSSPVSRFALEMAVRAQYLAIGISPGESRTDEPS